MKFFLIFILMISLLSCTTTKARRGSLSNAFEASESPGGRVPSYDKEKIESDPPRKNRDSKQKADKESPKKFKSELNVTEETYLGTTIGYDTIPLNPVFSENGILPPVTNMEEDSIILPSISSTISTNMNFEKTDESTIPEESEEKNTKIPTPVKTHTNKKSSGTDKFYFGLGGGYIRPLFGDLEHGPELKVSIGTITYNYGFLIEIGIGGLSVKDNSSLYDVIKRDTISRSFLGLEIRKHITNRDRMVFWDFIVNTNFTWLHWSFKNELTTPDNEIIKNDNLLGLTLGIGAGLCVWNNNNIATYLDATMNYSLVGTITNEGFDNDVYEDYIFLRVEFTFLIGVVP